MGSIYCQISNVERIIACSMPKLSKTYAQNMSDWVVPKYFDPEAERHRLLTHDFQQTEIQQIRCMQNTKPVNSIELPLEWSRHLPKTICIQFFNILLSILKKTTHSVIKKNAYSLDFFW